MQLFWSVSLALALLGPTTDVAAPAPAAPAASADDESPSEIREAVETAERAWRAGNYLEVRRLLEPHAQTGQGDVNVRAALLTYLADATVADRSLDRAQREQLARGYLNDLLRGDPQWELPRDIYTPELYELYREVRADRAQAAEQQCRADLTVCKVDASASIEKLEAENATLRQQLGEQRVLVQEKEFRSRIFATIPFGVGQFYNGDRGLGWTFLSLETAFGVTGLALVINRLTRLQCRRTRGFQEGSLSCASLPSGASAAETDRYERRLIRFRRAEEAMGWLFLGTVVLDVMLAQIRFKPVRLSNVREVPRKDLDKELARPPERSRRRRRSQKPRATLRPSPVVVPAGAGLGVDIEF